MGAPFATDAGRFYRARILRPMPFELWRQDDNGNRFLVDTFADRHAAEERLRWLTRSVHKQTWWISGKPETPDKESP